MANPVTPSDALAQLRLTADEVSDERQTEIAGFVLDATAFVEGYTGLILTARDVTRQFRVPARAVELPGWPIKADAEVTITVNGIPDTGARLDTSRRPARILPAAGTAWPMSSTDQLLTVTYRAGLEASEQPPPAIRRAILVLISGYDADREGGAVFQQAEASARAILDRANLRLRRV